MTNHKQIYPDDPEEVEGQALNLYEFVSPLLRFKDPTLQVALDKFQQSQSSFMPVFLCQLLATVFYVANRVGFIVYYDSGFAIFLIVFTFLFVILLGWVLVYLKYHDNDKKSKHVPVLEQYWVMSLIIAFNLSVLFMSGHRCRPISLQNFLRHFGCSSVEPHKMNDAFMIAALVFPSSLPMIVQSFTFRNQVISWLIAVFINAFCITYYNLYESAIDFLFYAPFSMIVLYGSRRQQLTVFLLSWKQKTLMEENRRLLKASYAAEMKSLIGNMAHDLKTPLSGFISGVEMVTSLAQDVIKLIDAHSVKHESNTTNYHMTVVKTHDTVLEKIHQIQSTLDHITHTNTFMLMIINRCIDFTKVSNGFKLEPRSEVVQLRELLDIPIKCMRDMQNRIKIQLNPVSDQIAQGIVTDRQWLLDNVLCMLGNAVKYSHYGTVKVTVSLESNGCEVFQKHLAEFSLVFEFEDTGSGVSPQEKKELFVSILQTKRSSGGTGLGLYSLAKRIDALNGSYGVKARKDNATGSRFWFSIPYFPDVILPSGDGPSRPVSGRHDSLSITDRESSVSESTIRETPMASAENSESNLIVRNDSLSMTRSQRSALVAAAPPPPVLPAFGKLNILLVDDSMTILKMSSMILRKHGHTVVAVENGAEALQLITESHQNGNVSLYDVVLMDLQMPIMDGLEATSKIRALENSLNSPKSSRSSGADDVYRFNAYYPSIVTYDLEGVENESADASLNRMLFEKAHNSNLPKHHQRIIGVSANSDYDTMQSAFAAGVDAFIPKPFKIDVFNKTYTELLSGIRSEM